MILRTDWHGIWQVIGYDATTRKLTIKQGSELLRATLAEMIASGWNPRLLRGAA